MEWYVDKGLAVLIQQLKDKYPGIVIGTIGDARHTVGEHVPEADGSVDAADPMIGKAFSKADAEWLFDTLIEYKDKRIAYIIWDRQIVSSTVQPWKIREYTRSDPHTNHMHISVNDKHENDKSEWKLSEIMRKNDIAIDGMHLPTLKIGESDSDFGGYDLVKRVQAIVGVTRDGDYGPATAAAIKNFVGGGDGKTVNKATWIKLYGLSNS